MKTRKLKLFWFWLLPMLLCAEFVHWQGDYASAHRLARKTDKPLLVLITRTHDANTSTILRHTFTDQSYVQTINTKTVPVIVYADKRASYPVEMYYTTRFPTLFIVDAKQELFLHAPLYPHQITPKRLNSIIF